jgi:hypothetical protein
MPEVNFLQDGALIRGQIQYLSDNQRSFAIRSDKRAERLTSNFPHRLAPDFLAAAVAQLAKQPFLALFHPQWYW